VKLIIVGASGRIGKEVDKALSDSHEIVRVGVRSGDVRCDYTDTESVSKMFEKIGEFDSLISVAGGDSTFKSFFDLSGLFFLPALSPLFKCDNNGPQGFGLFCNFSETTIPGSNIRQVFIQAPENLIVEMDFQIDI
jgi:NAD(P)-dependent dehydrogenase (short-subunit alcohol dehydrogenase family)